MLQSRDKGAPARAARAKWLGRRRGRHPRPSVPRAPARHTRTRGQNLASTLHVISCALCSCSELARCSGAICVVHMHMCGVARGCIPGSFAGHKGRSCSSAWCKSTARMSAQRNKHQLGRARVSVRTKHTGALRSRGALSRGAKMLLGAHLDQIIRLLENAACTCGQISALQRCWKFQWERDKVAMQSRGSVRATRALAKV